MTIWLTNPARGKSNARRKTRAKKGGTMAKRKAPPRYKSGPKKGQFMPKRAKRTRSNPTRKRKRSTRRRTTAKRRTTRRRTRRNPPLRGIVGQVTDGLVDALSLSVGQGVTRVLPGMLRLTTTGNVGLAVSAAVAVGLGMAAEYVVGADTARMVTAGAFSVPLQAAALKYVAPSVPLVGTAFVPTLGAYPRRALPRRAGMGAYKALPPGASDGRGFPYGSGYAGVSGYDYAAGVM